MPGEGGYTLRREEKSAERIDSKRVVVLPLCRGVCKRLRAKELNRGDKFVCGAVGPAERSVRCWRLVYTGENSMPVGFGQVICSEWSKMRVER